MLIQPSSRDYKKHELQKRFLAWSGQMTLIKDECQNFRRQFVQQRGRRQPNVGRQDRDVRVHRRHRRRRRRRPGLVAVREEGQPVVDAETSAAKVADVEHVVAGAVGVRRLESSESKIR